MAQQTHIRLNDGVEIPQIGFGVWQVDNAEAPKAVKAAIEAGYRSIDTAAIYGNEEGVAAGIRAAGVPREQLFITTKLWNDRHGTQNALKAFDESLKKLRLEYVDLYLIHWPTPRTNLYVETWRALQEIKSSGRAKSVGVSNFKVPHLEHIIGETGIVPVINQIELHPRFQQTVQREFHARHKIVTESWSPLGQGRVMKDPLIAGIAQKHGRTPAQVALRWHIQNGLVAIPKSVTPARIVENFDVFNFELTEDDMAKIATLDNNRGRIGPDPELFT
ncbi:aldo/keto reductase [Dongia deserti]|uniref:aldo/keto reductase n=1 Tax=Dongia deserti TaxID=2268030 RepID=UPI000E6591B0|nr:aldo/keto reductase [Dongia deserti]